MIWSMACCWIRFITRWTVSRVKCVARALLPPEIAEGSRLVYEMMEYSLSE